jgi:hypothetical protein
VDVTDATPLLADTSSPEPAETLARLGLPAIDGRIRDTLDLILLVPGNERRGERVFPHPFPARMPLAIAKLAIEHLSAPGEIVLDPMVGSGTTTRAASLAGRPSHGIDMDPLAVILSRAFAQCPRANDMHTMGSEVRLEAERRFRTTKLNSRRRGMAREDITFLDYWFPLDVQRKLFCLLDSILEVIPQNQQGAMFTVFSSLIIARSSGVSFALDLSRTRPHKDPDKPIRDPFQLWSQRIIEFAKFSSNAPAGIASVDIQRGDARALTQIPDATARLTLSSPPYGTAIDYIRASKFSLVFLACPLATLREIRGTSIGCERSLPRDEAPDHIEKLLPRRENRSVAILRRYLCDLSEMLAESARTLRPQGAAIYAVGPSIVSTTRYDAADILAALGEAAGLRYVSAVRRTLSTSNRSLPPPKRASGEGAIHKRMNCEYYVGFTKD